MAQDLFGTFDQDLRRLLLAGSGSVASDDGLRAAQDGFSKLAARVPALAAVHEQIGKTLGAKGRGAATELLNLGLLNLRLRGAQAKPAPAAALLPLPPAAPLETLTPQHDLELLHRALTSGVSLAGKKIQRVRVIEDAVERGVHKDLRLLDLWVRALGDASLGDLVAERIMPELGEAAAARIELQFNPRGKSADARRLKCLVAIRGEAAKPLVEACLKATAVAPAPEAEAPKGKKVARKKSVEQEISTEVRAEAVAALAKVAPKEAEDRACALYKTEGQQDIRAACIEVMGVGEKTSTLELLLEALKDSVHVSSVAVESLQRFRHPKTTERVLALLTPEVLDIKPYKAPRAKAGQKLTKAQQQANQKAEQQAHRAIEEKARYACGVLQVLGKRPSPVVLERLIELFRTHPMPSLRTAAGEALKASGERRALEVLAERIDDEDELEALAVWAFFHLDLTTVFERMEPLLAEQALATKKGVAVAAKLLNEVSGEGYYLDEDEDDEDDAEQEAPPDAIPGLDAPPDDPDDDPEEAQYLARKLARFAFRKDPRWGAVALRLLAHKELGESCVVLLGNLRDPRGKAPLVGLLRDNLHAHGAAHALALLHDRSVIPDLIGLLKQKKINPSVISLLGTLKAAEAVDPLCDLLARENDQTNLIFDALRRIGDPRAAAPVARALLQKGVTSYPYQALRALRQFDEPAAVPHLQEALKKAKKSRNSWVVTQYEELITYLERDRKV